MKNSQCHLLWDNPNASRAFRTGVSLHSHTSFSEESLSMIPRVTRRVPFLYPYIKTYLDEYKRTHEGREIDLSRAFWTPPLNPLEAVKLERGQLHSLDLQPFVSITDHDTIQAPLHLSMLAREASHPFSVEWTIPFGPTFFHLGLHNLPSRLAPPIMADLAAYTAQPRRALLTALLEMLNENADTLVVLNHPLWDESASGILNHVRALGALIERYGNLLHALELNGLRAWSENLAVLRLARETGLPAISGGDRHGREPNANVNLTNAGSFAEFVHEVRYEKISDVLFLPHYREPLRLRFLLTMWDVMRDYPNQPQGRIRWADRVFYRFEDGSVEPLSARWKSGEPAIVRQAVGLIRMIETRHVRPALRLALGDREEFCL
ncbi:MAG TPA: hypothetical protein VKG25_06030 [Bryobacteraceae bacterium]|nr:hypothetical protein [Bryobacteraceae bacterium]